MRFYFGLIRDNGVRYVVTGEATPTLKDVTELTGGGVLSEECDWGPEATEESRLTLALTLLSHALSSADMRLVRAYADEVVAKMETGQKWMLSVEDIEKWAASRVVVQ